MSNLNKLIESTPAIRHNVLRRLRQVIAVIIVTALLLFISAGSLKWLYAWLYMAFYVLTNLIGFFSGLAGSLGGAWQYKRACGKMGPAAQWDHPVDLDGRVSGRGP